MSEPVGGRYCFELTNCQLVGIAVSRIELNGLLYYDHNDYMRLRRKPKAWTAQYTFIYGVFTRRSARMSFLPIAMRSVGSDTSFVHHKLSGCCNSITVWPRITKYYKDINADKLYNHTGYDITNCFRSAIIANKTAENAIIHRGFLARWSAAIGAYGPMNGEFRFELKKNEQWLTVWDA